MLNNNDEPPIITNSSTSGLCYNHINTTLVHCQRQYLNVDNQVRQGLQFAPAFIDRLEQETVLAGHDGCVNCLEWSTDGRLLASGSDDYRVMIWEPFRKRCVHTINTKHLGNMFSVKFLPRHNDSIIATCAADKFVYVYDVNHDSEAIYSCNCHTMRVKRLATSLDSPYVFWSAGEDGNILQLDMRESHRCRSTENSVKLISLSTHVESTTEAKCLAINPRRSEYLAVGASDPFARIYDRRMLKQSPAYLLSAFTESEDLTPAGCSTYYAPGQIVKNVSRAIAHDPRAITYLTFNANGTELLVNMGCEHVYRYDLQNAVPAVFFKLPQFTPPRTEMVPSEEERPKSYHKSHALPLHIEEHKKRGNEYLENGKLVAAIDEYSTGLAKCPNGEVLYLNRATALMRRRWFGDIYAALRDCHEAIRLDPSYVKAYFRLARALHELHRPNDAENCLRELIARFPSFVNNHGVLMLRRDIEDNQHPTTTSEEPAMEPMEAATPNQRLSLDEFKLRCNSIDYLQRYVGHCNITTDIKEANYMGDFIVAGSDDGNLYIWEKDSAKIRAVYRADSAIVNCVQAHPTNCMLATSGIDADIKIWSPCAPNAEERPNLISDVARYAEVNQQKMLTDPFELNTRGAICLNN